MSNKTLIWGAVVAVVGLLVFANFYKNNTPRNLEQASLNGVVGGKSAVDFSLPKLDGGTITLSEFKGKKAVVLDFWASWCPNCRRDMPNLTKFYEKYKDNVEVIGINLQENESVVRDFISSRGISFPIALDPFGQASNAFGIRYTNAHFLINKNGEIVRPVLGDISESDILSLIK